MDRNTEALAPFAFYPKSQGIVPTRQCAMVAVSPTMFNRKVCFKRYHGNTTVALELPNVSVSSLPRSVFENSIRKEENTTNSPLYENCKN